MEQRADQLEKSSINSLDTVTVSRDDIDSKAGKEGRGGEPRVPSSSATVRTRQLTVDLFEPKDDMVLIGEVAVIWFVLSVSCGHRH